VQLQASHTAALTQIDVYGAQVPPVRPTYIFALARPRTPAPLMHRSARLSGVLGWTPPVRTALRGRSNNGWCATGLASLCMALRGFAGPFDTSATWHVPRLKAQCDASTCNMQHQVAGRSRRSRGSLTHSTHGSQPSPPTLMAYVGSGAPRSRPYMRWSSTKAGRMPTQSASSRHSSSRPVRLTAQYLLCSALLAPVTVCAGMYLRHHYGHLVGRMASVVPWLVCAGAWRRRVPLQASISETFPTRPPRTSSGSASCRPRSPIARPYSPA
jgi:hypothetical protein